MSDRFEHHASGISGPATEAENIVADNGSDLPNATRAIYVGGAGDIALVTVGGSDVVFVGLQAGTILPIRAARVKSTGTTANNLIAMY